MPAPAHSWSEAQFANRPLIAYPVPAGHDDLIGSLQTYTIKPGDTLLDVGRWYGLSGKEVSEANNHLDLWAPPPGTRIVLPTEHILPEAPRVGILMNIPEMRVYYFYPSGVVGHHRGKLTRASLHPAAGSVVYTFPVGLGRFDWKTPVGTWRVTAKTKNPTWVVPEDIYEEHLERDGEAEHVIPGGEDDNPLGHYRLSLSLPEYAMHGTDVPWGVGMNVSHGCVRFYPEDIERLYSRTRVGTPGRFVYQPIKFGWRGDSLYVEVHDDLYAMYPGMWDHALGEVRRRHLENNVDLNKLEKAVVAKSGIPTYVMPGPDPVTGVESASAIMLPPAPEAAPAVVPASSKTSAAGGSSVNPSFSTEDMPGTLPTHVTTNNSDVE
ncbi:MAG TPA: L,D-transpeptidase family protein [Candidatus Binataceae bacterium]|nr:L,D-transpeptidase family protein [Candidatus Binataceae bacterium]